MSLERSLCGENKATVHLDGHDPPLGALHLQVGIDRDLGRVLVQVTRDGFPRDDVLGDTILVHSHRGED